MGLGWQAVARAGFKVADLAAVPEIGAAAVIILEAAKGEMLRRNAGSSDAVTIGISDAPVS
jgi:hypothetical protein